ncbi:hypothetical protein [Sphingomonas psychrotolerans]|uniref:Molybdopterin dinucleotide-binding domain-containing protein n=1 Tax=Sphingomonas psychrotolerans TaxID=1327635 RepID=A0A2K8MAH3_9SPHN|nr:hypothetical protein [Sphingomonas psychrotolerans]ATY30885.1 hypothetical protein CVN68_01880 [Sphingomonas psychrotolerans]
MAKQRSDKPEIRPFALARREGLIVAPYDIPRGCLGAYYPEANVLMPVEHHAEQSHVPAAKSVPVRIRV